MSEAFYSVAEKFAQPGLVGWITVLLASYRNTRRDDGVQGRGRK
jgi:hypothetical protein